MMNRLENFFKYRKSFPKALEGFHFFSISMMHVFTRFLFYFLFFIFIMLTYQHTAAM